MLFFSGGFSALVWTGMLGDFLEVLMSLVKKIDHTEHDMGCRWCMPFDHVQDYK